MRAWRIQTKGKDEEKARLPPALGPPLDKLPWDIAKDEFGVQGAEFIGCLARVLHECRKDEMARYPTGIKAESRRHPQEGANA
jgi:hypothetical protein